MQSNTHARCSRVIRHELNAIDARQLGGGQ